MTQVKIVVSLLLILLLADSLAVAADQTTREVQSQLEALGFYYGEVDGERGPETEAALRRYQIRNGLSVTGAIDEETLFSLRKGGLPSIKPKTESKAPATEGDVVQRDRDFLEQQETESARRDSRASRGAVVVDPPGGGYGAEPVDWGAAYADIFLDSPLERASLRTKRIFVARAQVVLRRYQFYGGAIDGIPGERTAQAILDFQRDEALRMTGRLDALTLRELGLWRPDGRYPRWGIPLEPRRKVYPGYWIR